MNPQPLPSRTVGLARTTTLKRNSPLARKAASRTCVRKGTQEPRQAPKTGDWSPEVREALQQRSGGVCEICGSRPGTDPHHRKPRRCRDHRVVNGLWVCRTCHRGAHEHPAEARDVYGWIVSASPNVKPEDVPLLVNGNRWVVLEAAGYRTAPEGWAAA